MQLSVIMTTYNSPRWLEKVLWGYSVQAQQGFRGRRRGRWLDRGNRGAGRAHARGHRSHHPAHLAA
ncbi:MAG: hypothetical protein U5K43_03160 [Halofilum sp. (in: g-proteobacteria)]|nr:hypothetical protein [Halofilum sp. (in: g-proteobacteria)]